MGTRKTKQLFAWIGEENPLQARWALNFLRRELSQKPVSTGRGYNPLQHANNLEQRITALQELAATPENQDRMRDLDARMRKAWDEKERRSDGRYRYYQFRMPTGVRTKLDWLRREWREPKAVIVESLIEQAHDQAREEKTKKRAKAGFDRYLKKTSVRLLKLEQAAREQDLRVQAQQQQILGLLTQLEAETHRRKLGLRPDLALTPDQHQKVAERVSAQAEALKQAVEAEVRLQPKDDELSPASKRSLQMILLGR